MSKIQIPMATRRLHSMMQVDFRRMFTTSRLPIFLLIALMMPILILTMTTMVEAPITASGGSFIGAEINRNEQSSLWEVATIEVAEDGTTVANPQTGVATTMEAFTNTWQIIGSESGAGMMAMDMAAMCNINLVFFMAGVFVCLFVADDFRSGYAKNLFTVRAKKQDYIISKTIAGFISGALMLILFFLGAIVGGAAAGLPFTLGAGGAFGLLMCMIAKIFLMLVFVAIAVLVSCFGKSKSWMSILLFAFAGMLLFMMIPMMTPLDSGLMNVMMCLVGGALFAAGLGTGSNIVLSKQDLV